MKMGDILRNLIEERNISQKQLATDLNIAPSTLGNYINNIREPDFETLKLFATYFGVTTDYLIGHNISRESFDSPLEIEMIRIFRSISKEQQKLYLEFGKSIIKMNSQK